MKIEFENAIRRLGVLCRLLDIKIAWKNPWVACLKSLMSVGRRVLKEGNQDNAHEKDANWNVEGILKRYVATSHSICAVSRMYYSFLCGWYAVNLKRSYYHYHWK